MTLPKSIVVLFAVTACGGGAIPFDQLAPETVKTICAKYAQCGVVVSQSSCIDFFGDLMISASYQSSIDSGKVKYDGAAARSCVDSYSKLSCDFSEITARNEACEKVYLGQVARGGTCASDIECASADFCAPDVGGQMCMGTCTVRVGAGGTATLSSQCERDLKVISGMCQPGTAEGTTCSNSGTCASGLYCHAVDMKCRKLGSKGEPCDSTNTRCGTFYTCNAGVCSELIGEGQSCAAPSGAVLSLTCKLELICDSTTKLCKARGGAGAACTSNSQCKDPLVCAQMGTTPGTCSTPAAEGQSCATVPCDDDTYCPSMTMPQQCVKRIAVGQPCATGQQCVTNSYCSTGKCVSFATSCP